MKRKFRPVRHPRLMTYVPYGSMDENMALLTLMESGYNVYQHPLEDEVCIVSWDKLTFGSLFQKPHLFKLSKQDITDIKDTVLLEEPPTRTELRDAYI